MAKCSWDFHDVVININVTKKKATAQKKKRIKTATAPPSQLTTKNLKINQLSCRCQYFSGSTATQTQTN